MALIHPLNASNADPYSLAVWAKAGQDPEDVLHLVRLWAYSPQAQQAHQRLGDCLHNRTTVGRRYKEIAIVRACTRSYGAYELFHHAPMAIAAGVSPAQVAAVQSFGATYSPLLDERDRACLQFVDELDVGRGVCGITWARAREHFNDTELLELALQAQYWTANARFTRSLESPEEPRFQAQRKRQAAGEAPMPDRPAPVLDPSTPSDRGYRLTVVEPGNGSPRSELWFERWRAAYGPVPALVQLWALNDQVQSTYQLAWESVLGGGLALDAAFAGLLARRVAMRNGSPAVAAMATTTLRVAAPGSQERGDAPAGEAEALACEFIDAWDAARALGDREVGELLQHWSKREVVEMQMIAGLVGGQARISRAVGIG